MTFIEGASNEIAFTAMATMITIKAFEYFFGNVFMEIKYLFVVGFSKIFYSLVQHQVGC